MRRLDDRIIALRRTAGWRNRQAENGREGDDKTYQQGAASSQPVILAKRESKGGGLLRQPWTSACAEVDGSRLHA